MDCAANANYQRNEAETFEIKSLKDGGVDGQLYTASTSADGLYYEAPKPELTSVARVVNGLDDKTATATTGITVTDQIAYSHLKNETTYTLVGKIMEIDSTGSVSEFATAKQQFTTGAGTGKSLYEASGNDVYVRFTNLDFTGKQGSSFVIYQYLYLGTATEGTAVLTSYGNNNNVIFPVSHADKTDLDQTFSVCGTIQVHKYLDAEGNPSGAEYEIKGVTDTSYRQTVTIGANGYSEIVQVPVGKYTVKETKVPTAGEWKLDTTEYPVEIKAYSGTQIVISG